VRETEEPIDSFQVYQVHHIFPHAVNVKKILLNDHKFIIPANTLIDTIMQTSPRKVIRDIYNKSVVKHETLVRPKWASEMILNGEAAFAVSENVHIGISLRQQKYSRSLMHS